MLIKLLIVVTVLLALCGSVAAQDICVRVKLGEKLELLPIPCPTPTPAEQTQPISLAIALAPNALSLQVGESVTVHATVMNTDGLEVSGATLNWMPTVEVQKAFPTCVTVAPLVSCGMKASAMVTGRSPGECGITAVMAVGSNLSVASTPIKVVVRAPVTSRLEASEATITAPMVLKEGMFSTTEAEKGSATFTFASDSAVYTVWAQVWGPSPSQDSFYVSVDGGEEDVFDITEGIWAPSWQWVKLTGRGGTPNPQHLNPRVLNLEAGIHTLRFRGREIGAGIKTIVVTADPEHVPQ